MISIKKNICGKPFNVNVEEYLSEQAEALLKIIANIESSKLKDNFRIQIGWSIFTIIEDSEGFKVVAPDYSKNPFAENTDDLTIALWIQIEQGTLLKKLKLVGETVSFQDKIVCAEGVLALDEIYLERCKEHEDGDSGWYIGPLGDSNTTDRLEAYYAYQLLKIRPSIIQTLVLPSGYIAVFNKDELMAVLDRNDIDVLPK